MGWTETIPIIGDLFKTIDRGIDVVDKTIPDEDKKNQLISDLVKIKETVSYIAELQTQTVPWIDGLHKLGRQILNLVSIIAVIILISMGHELTQWDVLVLGGGNVAYQLIKGSGRK